jgi:enamine deaminase RidA (YjgF/YER057c/UK114 family)
MTIRLQSQRNFSWVEIYAGAIPFKVVTVDIQRFHVGASLSDTAVHGGTVYLAGQIADDISQGIEDQTREVLGHIDRLLAEAGSDKTRILMCQIFLADLADFEGMNIAWNGWVAVGHAPPRATVQARLANPGWRVEMVVTAARA